MTEPPPAYASQAALAGLASEVEGLRRAIEHLGALPERVEDVAGLVARLAEAAAQRTAPAKPSTAPSWLDLPATAGPADAELLLVDLIGWLHTVYLRYADAAKTFPGCWLWHPDVIEELLWLRHAWHAAYRGTDASITQAGDWHDRQRPGVVRRIKGSAGMCSIENHLPGTDQRTAAVPQTGVAELIAVWWATNRDAEPPTPANHHRAAASGRAGGRR